MEKSLEKAVDVLQQYMYKTAQIFVKHNILVAKAIRQLSTDFIVFFFFRVNCKNEWLILAILMLSCLIFCF